MFFRVAVCVGLIGGGICAERPLSMHEAASPRAVADSVRPIYLINLETGKAVKVLPDAQGRFPLEKKRVYLRYEPLREAWVFDFTDRSGEFATNPPRYLMNGSILSGEYLGVERRASFYFRPDLGKGVQAWREVERVHSQAVVRELSEPEVEKTLYLDK